MEIREALNQATVDFIGCGLASPRLDAEVLLAHCLGLDRYGLYREPERKLAAEAIRGFQELTARRKRGEPVAYLIGSREFWSLPFTVNGDVLVPRPETEILVEEVIRACRDDGRENPRILEIGTGSGAVSVALAVELPGARITATDISPAALSVAVENAAANDVARRIDFVQGNLFAPLTGRFDVIVSNPPYIGAGEYDRLPREVKVFEPRRALLAGPEGTEFHQEIIREGRRYLMPGGRLYLEIGYDQQVRVAGLLQEAGSYEEIRFRRDYAGIERVAAARRKEQKE